jgi:hypothetical protein
MVRFATAFGLIIRCEAKEDNQTSDQNIHQLILFYDLFDLDQVN